MNARGLARTIRDLAGVPSRAARYVANRLSGRIQDGFDQGVSPAGTPWAALKASTLARGRTPPPLTESGLLRGATYFAPSGGAGVELHTTDEHGGAEHMSGRADMAARPYYPVGRLPESYREDIATEINAETVRTWKRGGS